MRDITTDKWNDEVWGISNPEFPSKQPAKLVFYFGRNDHWVAEQTRDDIIRIRGIQPAQLDENKRRGPKMMVCDDQVLHGFCVGKFAFFGSVLCQEPLLEHGHHPSLFGLGASANAFPGHSDIMARKTARFIQDIINEEDA